MRLHTSAVCNAVAEAKPAIQKTFAIYRWNPDKPEEKPTMQEYTIDLNKYEKF